MTQPPSLVVVKPGLLTVFEDAGRAGSAEYGVADSGAFDRGAWTSANGMVGNDSSAVTGGPAALEVLVGGLVVEASTSCVVGLAGPHTQGGVAINGEAITLGMSARIELAAGDRLELLRVRTGMRTYVAVPGGFQADVVLGSRSWDGTAQLGPIPLQKDQPLHILRGGVVPGQDALETTEASPRSDDLVLKPWPGPHRNLVADALDDDLGELIGAQWRVTPASNRTGIRLTTPSGSTLAAAVSSMASVPTIPGVIQFLPNGDLVIFGPDAPVTGGYPIIGVLTRSDLDRVAQVRPGQPITFLLDE